MMIEIHKTLYMLYILHFYKSYIYTYINRGKIYHVLIHLNFIRFFSNCKSQFDWKIKMKLAKLSSKIILCVLTILFWGVAAGFSYIGANIFMTYERYGDLFTYLHSVVPAFILIAAAFLMFLIGVIGICGLFSENRCLLGIVS